MTTLNDAKHAYLLLATSNDNGSIDDMEQTWLINQIIGPTTGLEQINDLYNLFYDEIAEPAGALPDRHFSYLRGKGYTGTLNDMWYQFWVNVVEPYFSFNGDGYITVPTLIDFSKPNIIEYTISLSDPLASNRDMWSATDNSCFSRTRATTIDFRGLRGGTGGNINGVIFNVGEVYTVTEVAQPVEIVNVRSVDLNTLAEQTGQVTLVPGGAAVAFSIGGNLGTSLYTGAIRDFKLYNDASTLIHHWPINEGVGTVINDIVGGDHGTLVPGTGGWVIP